MNKKNLLKSMPAEEFKGFEEFIESQNDDTNFLPRPTGTKKETTFENLTFLSNDSSRLTKLKNLLSNKLPFAEKYNQAEALIREQRKEVLALQKELFEICDRPDSAYRKSMGEIFNSFFGPPPA